jgi:putative peptide modification system cyclase
MDLSQTFDSARASAGAPAAPLLRTVLLCDIVDSTAVVERLGDMRAAALMKRHEALLRQLVQFCHGQIIDKADGVLAVFERPIQALDFALRYQRGLRDLGREDGVDLKARIGLHVGDVVMWANEPREVLAGAKAFELEGLAKPVAARLMGLALPGQILMSGMAQNLCQRAAGELGETAPRLRWLMHGRFRFKGVPAPMLVHEVGEPGLSPLRTPESGAKAWRELPLWRRPPVLALEMLLVGALVVGGVVTTLRSPPAIAFAERDWVVVADLQNRTDEPLFDDALDTALLVGLEQSRHVNVISQLQIERALERMQRQGQPVDRQLAAELALREGARAVILPTVAEVGGVVRVTLEVVDPASGTTVYSESADGRTADAVLAALDATTARVRGRLGEAISSIAATSRPLEQVTTDDLEALRAYSLGIQARFDSRWAEARRYFEEAIRHDPEFSMAYLRLAFLSYSENDAAATERYLALADRHRTHLSDREALFLDAALAVPDGPTPAMERLKVLAGMYPDEHRAYYNYAYFGLHAAQRYRDSLAFIDGALVPQNPGRASAYYLAGALKLALADTDGALKMYQLAEDHGLRGGDQRAYAHVYASMRRWDEAEARLAKQQATGVPAADFEQRLPEFIYPLDRGRWDDARAAVDRLVADAEAVGPPLHDALRLAALSLRAYAPDRGFASDLRAFVAELEGRLAASSRLDRRHLGFALLASGWMAAHDGDVATARRAIAVAGELPETRQFQANADMLTAVEAELEIADGRAAEAIARLAPRVAADDALYFLHAIQLRALAANGDTAGAAAEADWLVRRRGLAYAEFNSLGAWQGANLIESTLALDAAARLARDAGRLDAAEAHRAAFAAAWPGGRNLPAVVRRARAY